MRLPIRAVAVILKESEILVMHRIKNGKEYYVLPGGGVEDSETIEQTVLREVQEETSIKARVIKPLYHLRIVSEPNNSDQYYFLCEYLEGVPRLGIANESEKMKLGNDFYEPVWYPISKIDQILLFPLEIRDWLINDIKNGFHNSKKEAVYKISELRQSI